MKRFAMSLVLACALSTTALAGDIPSTGINSQEPPVETEPLGDIPSTGFASETWLDAIVWSLLSAI
jgi:hypothetical protein